MIERLVLHGRKLPLGCTKGPSITKKRPTELELTLPPPGSIHRVVYASAHVEGSGSIPQAKIRPVTKLYDIEGTIIVGPWAGKRVTFSERRKVVVLAKYFSSSGNLRDKQGTATPNSSPNRHVSLVLFISCLQPAALIESLS